MSRNSPPRSPPSPRSPKSLFNAVSGVFNLRKHAAKGRRGGSPRSRMQRRPSMGTPSSYGGGTPRYGGQNAYDEDEYGDDWQPADPDYDWQRSQFVEDEPEDAEAEAQAIHDGAFLGSAHAHASRRANSCACVNTRADTLSRARPMCTRTRTRTHTDAAPTRTRAS